MKMTKMTTKRRYAFYIARRKDDATMMREVTERACRQKMSSNAKWKMRAFLRRFVLQAQSSRACLIEVMLFHNIQKEEVSWGQNESESADGSYWRVIVAVHAHTFSTNIN